jgi:hypothetical protein
MVLKVKTMMFYFKQYGGEIYKQTGGVGNFRFMPM